MYVSFNTVFFHYTCSWPFCVWNQTNCFICSALFLRFTDVDSWAVIPIHFHCCTVFLFFECHTTYLSILCWWTFLFFSSVLHPPTALPALCLSRSLVFPNQTDVVEPSSHPSQWGHKTLLLLSPRPFFLRFLWGFFFHFTHSKSWRSSGFGSGSSSSASSSSCHACFLGISSQWL